MTVPWAEVASFRASEPNRPVQSMTQALCDHGSVIAVQRNKQLEYLVSHEHARRVLTEESSFNFQPAMAKLMGMSFIYDWCGRNFIRDVDLAIKKYLAAKPDAISGQGMTPALTEPYEPLIALDPAFPIFQQSVSEIISMNTDGKSIDLVPFLNEAVTKMALSVFLGEVREEIYNWDQHS
ncbi:hypothetical protein PWT90_01882 [Aphanocladium album]|nr:hypothetical protein PWT90_01882 [Aphanocladium album]